MPDISGPLARKAFTFEVLLADISDPKATSFPRLDALHAVSTEREARAAEKAAGHKS